MRTARAYAAEVGVEQHGLENVFRKQGRQWSFAHPQRLQHEPRRAAEHDERKARPGEAREPAMHQAGDRSVRGGTESRLADESLKDHDAADRYRGGKVNGTYPDQGVVQSFLPRSRPVLATRRP
jgi:hypothetical protein